MSEKKVTRNIQNLADLSLAGIENDIEYLLFVDNEELFPMSEYTKFQPIIENLAKLVVLHADSAARKMQDEVVYSVAKHLKDEVGKVVYGSKIPIVETLAITESEVKEAYNDW